MLSISPPEPEKFLGSPPKNCPASFFCWECGVGKHDVVNIYDRPWRYGIFQKYPKGFALEMAKSYKTIYGLSGRKQANENLKYWDKKLSEIDFNLAIDEHALEILSKKLAKQARRAGLNPEFKTGRIRALGRLAKQYGLTLPNQSEAGIIARLSDSAWWRRNLRKKHRQGLEQVAIALNKVNSKRAWYVSDESLQCHLDQKLKNTELLKAMRAINELEQEFTLKELADKSVSNPVIRRSELMVRIHGHEQYAKELGQIGGLFTITCPSRMHGSLQKSGDRNPHYDNSSPRDAQLYLNKVWARIRAQLKRENIAIHGMRVAEPHHDGTPHWHLLIFATPADIKRVLQIIRYYALADSPNEPGADKIRVDFKEIDWNLGTATGYIAKYISKNIDGYALDKEEDSAPEKAQRVQAWASTWRIRQFQFFGSPSVSIWRELRRLNPEYLPNTLIKDCCFASDNNDWHTFMTLMGGHSKISKDRPIQLLKIWSDKPGKYGEPIGYTIKGLVYDGISYISRLHTWRIELTRKSKQNLNISQLYGNKNEENAQIAQPGLNNEESQNLEFCQ